MGAKPPRLKINRGETTRGERLGGETSCYQVRLMKKIQSRDECPKRIWSSIRHICGKLFVI